MNDNLQELECFLLNNGFYEIFADGAYVKRYRKYYGLLEVVVGLCQNGVHEIFYESAPLLIGFEDSVKDMVLTLNGEL